MKEFISNHKKKLTITTSVIGFLLCIYTTHHFSYEAGYDDGYSSGYDSGYSYGKEEGYNEGYEEGHDEGYEEGFDEGKQEVYDEGYDDCQYYNYYSIIYHKLCFKDLIIQSK